MSDKAYGLVTVGGGLGGAALTKAMAERGARVLEGLGHGLNLVTMLMVRPSTATNSGEG